LNQVAPNFEQTTGNKLNIGYSLIADIRKRMLEGETADVIILSRPVMDELDKQLKFASGSITNIASTPVALTIRVGAPKPDISTVDALKRTLLDKAHAARRQIDRLCGSGKGRRQRGLFRARCRPPRDRRPVKV
jgi:ABC-type molybdate transport system substrate-binding protein